MSCTASVGPPHATHSRLSSVLSAPPPPPPPTFFSFLPRGGQSLTDIANLELSRYRPPPLPPPPHPDLEVWEDHGSGPEPQPWVWRRRWTFTVFHTSGTGALTPVCMTAPPGRRRGLGRVSLSPRSHLPPPTWGWREWQPAETHCIGPRLAMARGCRDVRGPDTASLLRHPRPCSGVIGPVSGALFDRTTSPRPHSSSTWP